MGTWLPSQLPIVHKNSLQSRRTDTALPVQCVRTFRYRYRYSMSVLLTCTAMEPATHCLASFHAQVPFENLIEPATHCFHCRRGRSRRTTPRNGFRCVLVRRVIAFAERTRGALVVDCSLAFTPNAGWTRGRGHRYRAAAAWDHSSTHSPLGGGTIPFCHSFFIYFNLLEYLYHPNKLPRFLPRFARCVHNCAT